MPAIRLLLVCLMVLNSAGCASRGGVKTAGAKAEAHQMGPGDVVSITVMPAQEYSREVTIQPDGKIELPLVGAIRIGGLTAEELQKLLREKLVRYVADPEITINVRRFSGRRVAIIGEVRSPGFYDYRDRMRLLDLVSMAGGLTENAKASKVNVLRPGLGKDESFTVNMKSILQGRLDRDVPLVAGDTIYVRKQRSTAAAAWVNANILPWATIFTIILSAVILSKKK